MKKLLIASLLSAQLLASATPAMAQNFDASRETEAGGFAGLRLRIPFAGGAQREPIRAGLAVAPAVRTQYSDGRARTRIGEGFEFGYRTGRPVSFSLAGRDLGSFRLNAAQGETERRRRGGPSTLGWIAIGVGVSVVILVGATALCLSDSDCIGSE